MSWTCVNIKSGYWNYPFERALATSPPFRRNGLRLCCDVPATDLEPAECTAAAGRLQENGRIDYLVCKGDQVILSIMVPQEQSNPAPFAVCEPPWIPSLRLTGRDLKIQNTPVVERWLEKHLAEAGSAHARLPTIQPSQEVLALMLRARLLEPSSLVPTEYGRELGVIRQYLLVKGAVTRRPCFSAAVLEKRLLPVLQPPRAAPPEQDRLPLARRIRQLDEDAVRQFARTPLHVYMRDFPDELVQLDPEGELATYQDAASYIYYLLQNVVSEDKGKELMRLLALPLLRQAKKGGKA